MGGCTSTEQGIDLVWDDPFSTEDSDDEEVQQVMDEVELGLYFEAMEEARAIERRQNMQERIKALGN